MAEKEAPSLMRALPAKQFDSFLEQAGATLPCPRCGGTEFIKMDEVATNQHAALVLENLDSSDLADRTSHFPVVPTTCSRCGWIAFHLKALVLARTATPNSASPAPVLQPPPPSQAQAPSDRLRGLEHEFTEIRSLLGRIDERTFHHSTRTDLSIAETNLKARIATAEMHLNESELRLTEGIASVRSIVEQRSGLGPFLAKSFVLVLLIGLIWAVDLRWGEAVRIFLESRFGTN